MAVLSMLPGIDHTGNNGGAPGPKSGQELDTALDGLNIYWLYVSWIFFALTCFLILVSKRFRSRYTGQPFQHVP